MSDISRPSSSAGNAIENPSRSVSSARLQRIIHRLEAKLQPLSVENTELKQRLELASLDIELAEEKSASAQSELEAAINSVFELETRLTSLSEQLSDARVVAENLTIENAEQEAELESLRKQLKDLEALRELNEELSELDSSRERELLHEIQSLQHDLERSRNQFVRAQARISELEALVIQQRESKGAANAEPIEDLIPVLRAENTDLKLKLKLAKVELRQFTLDLSHQKFGAAATLAGHLQFVEYNTTELSTLEQNDFLFKEASSKLFYQLREDTVKHEDLKQALAGYAREAFGRTQVQNETVEATPVEEVKEQKPIDDLKDVRIAELEGELEHAKDLLDAAKARTQVLESQAMRARKLARDLEDMRAELVTARESSTYNLQTIENLKAELSATAAELKKSRLADLPADLHSAAAKSRLRQTQQVLVSLSKALLQRTADDLDALPELSIEPKLPLRYTPKLARHPIVQACWNAIDDCGALGVVKGDETLVETRFRLSTRKRLLSVILAGGNVSKQTVGQLF